MARTAVTKHVARRQETTFADWIAELRDLAGRAMARFRGSSPDSLCGMGWGATPAQALHMVNLILPPKVV